VGAKGVFPGIEVLGIQSERFAAMSQLMQGQPVHCDRYTVAEGIAVKNPGRLTREVVREHVRDILLVGEDELEDAVLMLLQIEKTVVEGAGACGLAALLKHRKRFKKKKVGLMLSGGNVDLLILSSIIQRGLARNRQLVRLRVETRDVPGELARISGLIGGVGGNIMEVHHQRAFSAQPLQTALVDFTLQTRGREHLDQILGVIKTAGLRASLPDPDLVESVKNGH
ncbi:MAG TPA: pyridoxal-phosphate dependent enzyme, partial [Bacillota bacterium]|nr:pyridoxal-phosphate dependent enzyme [Bacillota bacterium]